MTRAGPVQLERGTKVPPQEVLAISGERLRIPDSERLVHLQFRRYAGCPVCSLHLRTIVQRHDEVIDAGILEIAVFHSAAETMLEFQGELPFAAVADPDRHLYAAFGVDGRMSPLQALSPRSWAAAGRALVLAPSLRGATGKGEEHLGLPADFLVASDGKLIGVKYGKRVDDHWSVDDLLAVAG